MRPFISCLLLFGLMTATTAVYSAALNNDQDQFKGESRLVYVGKEGLEYGTYANEGQNNAVNTVPDFSNAGYQGGVVAIPFIPAVVQVSNGAGDDTERIQDAIDEVSGMPMGTNGFRGAVWLEAGDYTVSRTLTLSASGVVIRGEGSQETGGTRITYTATAQSNLFEVGNKRTRPRVLNGSQQPIVDAYVPVGAKSFQVEDAAGFSVGGRIIIQNSMNQRWLDELSNMGQWGWNTDYYQLQFRREIVAIKGARIALNAPVVQAIEPRYGGGVIYKYSFAGELEHIGFEGLRLKSSYAGDEDEEHGWVAILIRGLKNGWVRQVTGQYFGYSVVSLGSYCQQITVEDCAMLDPKSITTGGRKYSFNIDHSQNILMQRCFTRGGRHDFVSGSRTPGPNVFVDCRANETYSDIGPHHRYSTGQLYDNVMGGEINVQNRKSSGTGHGWAGAQIMFWNCDASSIICDAPKGAMNWSVGSRGEKSEPGASWAPEEPFGIWDSHGTSVFPRSLYYAQLADRLGNRALNNVRLPRQEKGRIWEELDAWAGEGRFGDAVVAHIDETPVSRKPINIRGVVRDLNLLERGFKVRWQKISGPGNVVFAESDALETQVVFAYPGIYQLRLVVGDKANHEIAMLRVNVKKGS